jgi:hypothetical protein
VEAIRIIGQNKAGENIWSCKCACGWGCTVAESRLGIKACGEHKGDNQIGIPEPPRIDVRQYPEFAATASRALGLIGFLREPVAVLERGDGFRYAGSIIGARKHAAKQLEELLDLLAHAPEDFVAELKRLR